MTYEARAGFIGLLTNVAETRAPDTGLRVADNVVVRQPGALEPRQGFEPFTTEYSLASTDLTQGQAHGPDMVFETNGNWRNKTGTQRLLRAYPDLLLAPSAPLKLRTDSFSTALARGNMYLPHSMGVAVATSSTMAFWRCAGVADNPVSCGAVFLGQLATAPYGLPPMSKWAYRFVMTRTDENGLIVRGEPTGAIVVKNTHATDYHKTQLTAQAFGSISWPSYPHAIEVYRTRAFPIDVAPDDEMGLCATMAIVNTSGQTGLHYDDVQDEQRGAALYTNPSREGFEGKNDQPPACSVVEPYRGHLFFGDCIGPQRVVVSHGLRDRSGSVAGVGWRSVTATVTLGSPTITGVTPTAGLQPGMVRRDFNLSRGYITAIVGSTVTMSENQTGAAGVGIAVGFVDAIQVDGSWLPLTNQDTTAYGDMVEQTEFEDDLHYSSSGKFAGTRITPALSGFEHTHIIEHTARNGAPFSLRGTHGDEMSPPLPLYDAPALLSTLDARPNMLMWSKQEEPEHVPPTNYVLIGEKDKRLLALAHTKDALFIFKEDGIWRLSGYAGQWSIDPFDVTCFCILPSSVKRLKNRIYALTNQGVVAVSDDGVELVSFAIADQTRKLIDNARANFVADGFYHLSGVDGVAASVDDRNGEYQLLVGTTPLDLNGAQALVYNELSNAWTTFSFTTTGLNGFSPQALALAPDNTPLILHNGGVKKSSYATETTLGQTTRRMYDGAETAVNVTVSTSAGVVTISAPQTLVADRDVLIDSIGTTYDIASIGSTTAFTVRLPLDALVPALGTGSIRRGYECAVQPHGFLGTPQLGKHWCSIEVGFSRFLGAVRMAAVFSSAQPMEAEPTQSIEQEFELYRSSGMTPFHLGTLALLPVIPVDHARAWLLRARIKWLAVRGIISLELVQLDARVLSPKKPQQSSSGAG